MTRGQQDNPSPVTATRHGKAQRRRAPRRVQAKIDWSFADLIDAGDVDPNDITELADGDLEIGDAGGLARLQFTDQYYRRTLPISDDDVRSFAEDFGIEDIATLRDTLALVAREIDDVDPAPRWVMRWQGEEWSVCETYAGAHSHAVEHVEALLKLVSGPFWPVALDKEPERARRALTKYQHWLAGFRFEHAAQPKGQPPLAKEQVAAYVLAWAWPVLTDEEPCVAQVQNDEKRPGRERERPLSRFNAAFLRLCRLSGLRQQVSSKALAGWLAKTAAQRAAHHAELNRRAGTD